MTLTLSAYVREYTDSCLFQTFEDFILLALFVICLIKFCMNKNTNQLM